MVSLQDSSYEQKLQRLNELYTLPTKSQDYSLHTSIYLRNPTIDYNDHNNLINYNDVLTSNYSYQSAAYEIDISPSINNSRPETDYYSNASPVSSSLVFENDFDDDTEVEEILKPKATEHEDGWVNPALYSFKPLNYNDNGFISAELSILTEEEQRTAEILFNSLNYSTPESHSFSDYTTEYETSSISSPDDRLDFEELSRLAQRKRRKPSSAPHPDKKQDHLDLRLEEKEYIPILQQISNNPVILDKIQSIKKKGIYKCAHCTEFFPDLLKLAQHLDEFKVSRPFKCPFNDCPWSLLGLPRKAEVRRHCLAQHEFQIYKSDGKSSPKVKLFQCTHSDCLRTFKRKDSFRRHERMVHLTLTSRFNKRIEKKKEHKNCLEKINDVHISEFVELPENEKKI